MKTPLFELPLHEDLHRMAEENKKMKEAGTLPHPTPPNVAQAMGLMSLHALQSEDQHLQALAALIGAWMITKEREP